MLTHLRNRRRATVRVHNDTGIREVLPMTEQLVTIAAFNKVFEGRWPETTWRSRLRRVFPTSWVGHDGLGCGYGNGRRPIASAIPTGRPGSEKPCNNGNPSRPGPLRNSLSSNVNEELDLEDEGTSSHGDARVASRACGHSRAVRDSSDPQRIFVLRVLLQLFAWDGELTPAGTRKMRAALVVDCMVLRLHCVATELANLAVPGID